MQVQIPFVKSALIALHQFDSAVIFCTLVLQKSSGDSLVVMTFHTAPQVSLLDCTLQSVCILKCLFEYFYIIFKLV